MQNTPGGKYDTGCIFLHLRLCYTAYHSKQERDEQMLSKIITYGILGIKSFRIDVETNISRGIPEFDVVGQGDVSIKEARVRVRTAINNSGYKFPDGRIAVNLAPAGLRKEGAFLDLPMAIGILAAGGEVRCSCIDKCAIIGELSLNGSVRSSAGVLVRLTQAAKEGAVHALVPCENANEAFNVKELNIFPVENLKDAVRILNSLTLESRGMNSGYLDKCGNIEKNNEKVELQNDEVLDFSDVKGQYHAKRAMEIAACGGHNIIMVGAAGCGKTMLGKRFSSILPPLSDKEAYEVTGVYSLARMLPAGYGLMKTRPLRLISPGITRTALIGGGRPLIPGEISLAHKGVLFMDEMTEYDSSLIQLLRRPLEQKNMLISRLGYTQNLPTDFIFIGAANPCRCGKLFEGTCKCTPLQIKSTISRISKPILDRVDIHIPMKRVPFKDMDSDNYNETSDIVRSRVIKVREFQKERYKKSDTQTNSSMTIRDREKYCILNRNGKNLLQKATEVMGLSARAYDKVLKIARTIADMEFNDSINEDHIAEAISYRTIDNMIDEK